MSKRDMMNPVDYYKMEFDLDELRHVSRALMFAIHRASHSLVRFPLIREMGQVQTAIAEIEFEGMEAETVPNYGPDDIGLVAPSGSVL